MIKSKFQLFLQYYYSLKSIRILMNTLNFICQITLVLYLMAIPIQIAYYWLISSTDNLHIQSLIDKIVIGIFGLHIVLYFDSNFQKINNKPHIIPTYSFNYFGKWSRLFSIQIIYDLIAFTLSILMLALANETFIERQIEILFVFKIYKLYKFHKKTIFVIIGTPFYLIYKIIFTIFIVFMAISYFGSMFYGFAYLIYQENGPNKQLLWIVSTSTIPNLVNDYPFLIQLQYALYWALGTSSTAAYGDVSAHQQQMVIYNVIALLFVGFLYGFYLNNIHSIPLQAKQDQLDLISKFDQFQKHNKSMRKQNASQIKELLVTEEIYLKIICSLQYKQTQRAAEQNIKNVVPQKYFQQIQYQIYSNVFENDIYGFFRSQNLKRKIAVIIKEVVCEANQNVYLYSEINQEDLIFVSQGSLIVSYQKSLKGISSILKQNGQFFGIYNFIMNQCHPTFAVAKTYTTLNAISRKQYKDSLSLQQKIQWDKRFGNCLMLRTIQIQNEPYLKYNQELTSNNSIVAINGYQNKWKILKQTIKKRITQRTEVLYRPQTRSKRIYNKLNRNINCYIQTQERNAFNIDNVIIND